jgi:hypothetical protein
VPLPNGIRSLNEIAEFDDSGNLMPTIKNGYGNNVHNGKPLGLHSFIDGEGRYRYYFVEMAASTNDTLHGYFYHLGNNLLEKFMERPYDSEDDDPDLRHTIFQTRSLFLKDASTTLTWPTGAVLEGDTTADEAFIEISGDAPTVTYYAPSGIIFDPQETPDETVKGGISSFGNYLLTWDENRIYWCNPLDFTDWTISNAGGGSTQISEARGAILTVVPATDGIMVYCKGNVVYGAFSGDATNPWIFSEVEGSGGLIAVGGNKLVTRDPETSTQIALTTKGMIQIQQDRAQALPPEINYFLSGNSVDFKPDGSITVEKLQIDSGAGVARTIVRNLFLRQNTLLIYCGEVVPKVDNIENSRLLIYNLDTGSVGVIEGDIPALSQRVDVTRLSDVTDAQNASLPGLLSHQFAMVKRIVTNPNQDGNFQYEIAMRILDLANTSLPQPPMAEGQEIFGFAPSQVVIGDISVSPDRLTEIHSVRIIGQNTDKFGNHPATVRVYSEEEYGATAPVTFYWNADRKLYQGYATGGDLRIEIEGYYLYVTHIEVEISRGASR